MPSSDEHGKKFYYVNTIEPSEWKIKVNTNYIIRWIRCELDILEIVHSEKTV